MFLYWEIFWSFLKATLLGYGGGPSIIPLYEAEAVYRHHWLSEAEFGDTLALGNALPGPIATKMSAFVGYRVGGWFGALAALAGVVLPTAIALILILSLLGRYKDNPVVAGMVRGVRPVVFVMLAMLAGDFFKYAFASGWASFAIAAAYFIAVVYFKLNPAYGILGALVLGGLALRPTP